ncbi:hypothetical protein FACS1894163_10480 [Spirochaetia bacterium]|nr:hypothetical protein FACS1894163_10480 [Spirochaetia bacterium]
MHNEKPSCSRNMIRYRSYEIIENTRDNDLIGAVVNKVIIVLICLNIMDLFKNPVGS